MKTKLEENLEIIKRIKKELNDKSAHLLFLTISGSHLYGFSSKNSDIDYRGVFIYNTSKWLGLSKPSDIIELKWRENDIVLLEVRKFIGLALKSNCNVLEWLSTKGIYNTKDFLTLKEKLLNSFGKDGLHGSYKGLANENYRKFILSGRKNTVKKYLYIFRSLMAGIYALENKKIEPEIGKLNSHFKIPIVKELVKLKRQGKEDREVPRKLDKGVIEDRILKLFERIDNSWSKSSLPERPSDEERKEIEDWLLGIRKRFLN